MTDIRPAPGEKYEYETGPTARFARERAAQYAAEAEALGPFRDGYIRFVRAAADWKAYAEWAEEDERGVTTPTAMLDRSSDCYNACIAVAAKNPERSNQLYVASVEWKNRAQACLERDKERRLVDHRTHAIYSPVPPRVTWDDDPWGAAAFERARDSVQRDRETDRREREEGGDSDWSASMYDDPETFA